MGRQALPDHERLWPRDPVGAAACFYGMGRGVLAKSPDALQERKHSPSWMCSVPSPGSRWVLQQQSVYF